VEEDMTAILALVNKRHAIQLSDRRLTAHDRKVVEEHSNKATVLTCANGRFAVGYTGLARVGRFRTQHWLLDALLECGPPEFGIFEMMKRFLERAKQDFASLPDLRLLVSSRKRLTIMLTGYAYRDGRAFGANILITNFQDWKTGKDLPEASPDFWDHVEVEKDDSPPQVECIQRIGAWKSITGEELHQLRVMLREDKPIQAIVDKGCAVLLRAAERPSAAGTVGKEIMSVVVPSAADQGVSAVLKPGASTDVAVLTDQVVARPDLRIVMRDMTFGPVAPVPGKPFLKAGPKRNDPCPCGSGKKYKKCCLKK
jgi:hypothetical protein